MWEIYIGHCCIKYQHLNKAVTNCNYVCKQLLLQLYFHIFTPQHYLSSCSMSILMTWLIKNLFANKQIIYSNNFDD